MLRVTVNDIRPGMELAIPVLNPERPSHILLRTGYALTNEVRVRLGELGIGYVFVRFPGLESLSKYVNSELVEAQGQLAQRITSVFEQLQGKTTGQAITFNEYVCAVEKIVQSLVSNPAAQVYMMSSGTTNPSLRDHSIRMVYLCLLMGIRLDWYLIQQRPRLSPARASDVKNLAIGALLHDVGLIQIGHDDPYEERPTDRRWLRHIMLGYRAVGASIEPSARVVIAQHHQRFDGTGFPKMRRGPQGPKAPLVGHQIHVFARIAYAAKLYDRLVQQAEAEGRPSLPLVALREILHPDRVKTMDPVVVRALLDVTPAFPPGTMVRLSDHTLAAVTLNNPAEPCRPTVLPITEKTSERTGPIDLAKQRDLEIIHADGVDVHAYLFELPRALLPENCAA